jgi:hypothetical protein
MEFRIWNLEFRVFNNLIKFMNKNLKVLGMGVLLIGLAVAGWFLVAGQSQKTADKMQESADSQDTKQSIKSEEQKRVEEQKKEKDLVWYEIPEMNIKFLVEKEMADLIGYRDFYVMDIKADGKELYIKNGEEKAVFGYILVYNKNNMKKNLKYTTKNTKIPQWGEICIGIHDRILFHSKNKITCYQQIDKKINIKIM